MGIFIGKNIIRLQTTDSTNNYALELLKIQSPPNGTIVITDHQEAGRGQLGNSWESEKGLNLTFSIILYPYFIPPEDQFSLSKVISLGVADFLKTILKNVTIKWPNDIYVDNLKIAGILIENSIIGNLISYAVVGIGLNVNQTVFKSGAPNPTSIKLKAAKFFDLANTLSLLLTFIENRYLQLELDWTQSLNKDYLESLYRFNTFYKYETDDEVFTAKIIDVNDQGMLVLITEENEIKTFGFKEVSYVL